MKSAFHKLNRLKRSGNPVRYAFAILLAKTNLSRMMKLKILYRPGVWLWFHPDLFSARLWANPKTHHTQQDATIIDQLLESGDTFVDVGANIGVLSCIAATSVGPTGSIYSIEPHPETFRYLQKNLGLNKITWVYSVNSALGTKNDTVYFTDYGSNRHSINSVSKQKTNLEVQTVRLDNILPSDQSIKLLKIDTEGYELPVLQGAEHVLSQINAIYFESCEHHFARFDYSSVDIFAFLNEHEFTIKRLVQDEWTPIPAGYISLSAENLLATKSCNTS